MSLKKITSVLTRVGLGLAVAGTTVFAVGGCSIPGVDSLTQLVQGLIPGLGV